MVDNSAASSRLQQLRERWEVDHGSRVFLQLAEEYRRQGQPHEALDVLTEALATQAPTVAALVALGRCHLDLGDYEEARDMLENVLRRDPTQMVAYRALIEVYLGLGDAAAAEERLALYEQLTPLDPALAQLREQLRAQRVALAAESVAPVFPAAPAPIVLETIEPSSERGRGEVTEEVAEPTRLAGALESALPAAPLSAGWDALWESDDEPGSHPPDSAERLTAPVAGDPAPDRRDPPIDVTPGGQRSETLSELGAVTEIEPEAQEASLADVKVFPPAEDRSPGPGREIDSGPFDLPPLPRLAWAPATLTPRRLARPYWEVGQRRISKPVIAGQAPAPATATLGRLYLEQGHAAEAATIFEETLSLQPANSHARLGLTRARQLLRGSEPIPGGSENWQGLSPNKRRERILRAYLQRIEQGRTRAP